ncbi:MAG: ABC transporter substrate-binding protein [Planctomycetaceae bacterium]|nr:ABC transporter substrate-binding protein [Planctomycetaceae bacterium]
MPLRSHHILVLLCAALGWLGCNGSSSPSPDSPSTGSPGDAILIGHYASMTGSEATYGVSTDNGIKLAIKERNATGGVNGTTIELKTYDEQGKSQEVSAVVSRLIEEDHVVAVLGEVASSRSLIGAPICQRLGVPMITPSSTNPDVTMNGDMIFRVCFIDPFQGFVGAKFAHDNLKLTKAGVLFNRAQAYSSGLKDNFVSAFKEMGGQVVSEQAYGDGDNDFSAQLTAIREAQPEFIYVPGYYTDVVNIAKQAKQLGIKVPLIGGDGWDSEELKNAGDALNGCYYSNHYSHEDTRPAVQEFVTKYKAAYGKVPDGLAALGYDAARILFDAMERAESLDGDDLARAISETKDFQAVTGVISIDAQRNAQKDAVVLEVVDGKPKFVATVTPN